MSNYYEILELKSTATQAEIKTAIDEKYAYWNSLASHHDPRMVEKASREKRQLEEIRAVLGSKAKRKKYDVSFNENIGGLAEQTSSKISVASEPAPIGSHPIAQLRVAERLDAWVCPKCNRGNAIEQKFCAKCGGQIGEECPECMHLSQITNMFCPNCGINKAQTIAKIQEHEVQIALELKEKKIGQLLDTIQSKRNGITKIERLGKTIPWWGYEKENASLHRVIWDGFNSCLMIFLKFILSYLLSFFVIYPFFYSFSGWDFFVAIWILIIVFIPVSNFISGHVYRIIKVRNRLHIMIQQFLIVITKTEQEVRQLQMQ